VSREDLRELLTRLREHLHSGADLDAEARRHLGALTRELESSLGVGDEPAHGAALKLESLAVKFEVDHPALAETLREVIDALGKAGI